MEAGKRVDLLPLNYIRRHCRKRRKTEREREERMEERGRQGKKKRKKEKKLSTDHYFFGNKYMSTEKGSEF